MDLFREAALLEAVLFLEHEPQTEKSLAASSQLSEEVVVLKNVPKNVPAALLKSLTSSISIPQDLKRDRLIFFRFWRMRGFTPVQMKS